MGGKYIEKEKSVRALLVVLGVIGVISIVLAVGLGPVYIPPLTAVRIILHRMPFVGERIEVTWETLQENIVIMLRLPRVLLGMIVGASLAVCGVSMQALVRNKLAEPYILGVSSGAAAFATLGMLFNIFSFLGAYSLSLSAFLGAMVTIIFVYILSYEQGRISIPQILLTGVAISMIMDGITSIIKLSAPNALGLHNAEFWMSGSLAGAKWVYLRLPFFVLTICITFLMLHYRGLNLLLMGEESAGTLGINVPVLHKELILVSSLMAGVAISVSGSIGFVGLMVPHFTRLLVGSNHKRVIPVAALMGAILVVWVDVMARLIIAPEELPVGILTAVIGGPIFIWMLKKQKKK